MFYIRVTCGKMKVFCNGQYCGDGTVEVSVHSVSTSKTCFMSPLCQNQTITQYLHLSCKKFGQPIVEAEKRAAAEESG